MKRYGFFGGLVLLCAVAFLCCGCGKTRSVTDVKQSETAAIVSMEAKPIVNYTLPTVLPNILVNQRGYATGGHMKVAVKGTALPKHFRLVNADSDIVLYEGLLEDISFDAKSGIYTGYADIGDYAAEGNYYLECDRIGRSLDFRVQGDTYKELFLETYHSMIATCQKQTATESDVAALLTVYEWYPGVFSDGDLDEIPDVLEEVAAWIARKEKTEDHSGDGPIYVATLAKFSYLYQKHDIKYATECLQHASAVFEKLQKPLGKDADIFYALTELYRATGLYTYRKQIADYAEFFKGNAGFVEESSYLYGAMTYIATRQKVDVSLCEYFTSTIMNRGVDFADRYRELIHPVSARNNGADDLLKKVKELTCSNYIMNNYEYTRILEEFLHYLLGGNVESVCFYPQEGQPDGYLFLLAQLAATAK